QGPHHSAQKSTTTGSSCERLMTAVWKLLSVTSIYLLMVEGGCGRAPDRARRRLARLRGGRRWYPCGASTRPDRHPALRGDGLKGARARRASGGLLRRPRPRTLVARALVWLSRAWRGPRGGHGRVRGRARRAGRCLDGGP